MGKTASSAKVIEITNEFNLTWSCHFCDEIRPDDCISVASKTEVASNGLEWTRNMRFCNDSVKCWTLAEEWRLAPSG